MTKSKEEWAAVLSVSAFALWAYGPLWGSVFLLVCIVAATWITWAMIPVGTKSLLVGVHQFALHPFFVARAWIALYGWPWHPYVWLSFIVHDWGYWGKTEMDGPSGDLHPYVGAKIMGWIGGLKWYEFALYHSRFLAHQLGADPSRLCMADKYAFCFYPRWLYLILGKASGEIWEYMRGKNGRIYEQKDPVLWFNGVKAFCEEYVKKMRNGGKDTITKIDPRRNGGA